MAQLDAFKNYNIDFSLNLLSESSTYQSLGYWALSVGESLSIREAKRCQLKQCGIYFFVLFYKLCKWKNSSVGLIYSKKSWGKEFWDTQVQETRLLFVLDL